LQKARCVQKLSSGIHCLVSANRATLDRVPRILPANFVTEESCYRWLYIASITYRRKLSWLIVFVKCKGCAMTFRNGEDLKRHRIAHEPDDRGALDNRPEGPELDNS
jgi:hypothetical protein